MKSCVPVMHIIIRCKDTLGQLTSLGKGKDKFYGKTKK